jgi:hypothetical protein
VSKAARALFAALLAIVSSAVLTSGSATAALTHPFASEFPTSCAPGDIEDIAIDETNGYVYVGCEQTPSSITSTVKRFFMNGAPAPFSFSAPYLEGNKILYNPGSYNQQFGDSFFSNVAVDNSGGVNNGSFMAMGQKPQGGSVDLFKPTGEWYAEIPVYLNVCTCGLDVGPNGHIYVGINNRIVDYNPGLQEVGRIYTSNGDDEYMRADSTGALWMAAATFGIQFGGQNLRKIETGQFIPGSTIIQANEAEEQGLPLNPIPSPFAPPDPFLTSGFTGFDIDPTNDELLVNRGNRVEVYSNGTAEEPAFKDGPDFGEGKLTGSSRSVAVNQSREVWVAEGDNVIKFGAGQILPDMLTKTAQIDDIGHNSAVVTGRVERAGGPEITSCEVQYGTTTAYTPNPPVPCASPSLPFTGSSTDVSATLPGLTTGTTYHYRIRAGNANGTNVGVDRTVTPVAVIKLHTKPAAGVDSHGATLEGSLDADGYETHYYFEYGLDTEYGQTTTELPASSSPGIQSVGAPITGLPSGKTFHYRLVARNSLGTTFGPDLTFRTASPPEVAGLRATEILEHSATLNARINPAGYDTTYQFEYGTSPSYGSKVPLTEPEDLGSGVTPQPVSAPITGLEIGVTYHFRVVAENEWGMTRSTDTTFDFLPPNCPNAHVRQQTHGSYLPDCRAYELVSPANAGSILMFPSDVFWEVSISSTCAGCLTKYGGEWTVNTGLATNPPRFAYFAGLGAIEELNGTNSLVDMYAATRTTTGWQTTLPSSTGNEALLSTRHRCTDSLNMCLDHNDADPFYAFEGLMVQTASNLFDIGGERLATLPTNVNTIPGAEYELEEQYGDEILSGDGSHYAFSAIKHPFAPGGIVGAPGSAYDNDIGAKTVTLISKLPDGKDIPQLQENKPLEYFDFTGISTDGSHILMQQKGVTGPVHLYMRVNDLITYDVSRSDVKFIGMTSNGSKVIFSAAQQLTPDDTDNSVDIYMWEEEGDKLTRLSKGNGQGDTNECAPTWGSQCDAVAPTTERGHPFGFASVESIDDYIAGKSGDVYFYSPESLDPDNPAFPNARNFYVYREGAVHLVATLDPGTEINRLQISPDGSHAGFITAANLTGYDTHGFKEMYTYDAETGALRCASCRPDGLPPTGNALGSQSGPFMSDDGRVFWATKDSLVSRDVDEGIIDVYEFVGGRPQLITSGTGSRDSTGGSAVQNILEVPNPARTGLESVSADGTDVFFTTYDSLVPQDENGPFIKFYDARVGGGFGPSPEFAPCAAADECHGVASSAPPLPNIGTGADLGASGNVHKAGAKKKRKPKRHRRRRHRRHHGTHGGGRHG